MTETTLKTKSQVKVTESVDGSVKITQPTGKHHAGVTVLLESDDMVRHQAAGFVNFLQEYAVVGLALGFIVGQQANGVVKQFVASFVDPLSRFWLGTDLSKKTATIHDGTAPITIPWGAFVYALLEFFIVLLAMYIVIKAFKLDRFATKKEKEAKK
jgi:large conductance mechanosensitive channel